MQLEFIIVEGQTLMRADHEKPVENSKGYLKAHFTLPNEYTGNITANFKIMQNGVLVGEDMDVDKATGLCMVPDNVIKKGTLYVSLSSTDTELYISTNEVLVSIGASGVPTSPLPLPDNTVNVYEDVVLKHEEVVQKAEEVKELTANQPYIGENQNWYVWSNGAYVDSGLSALGEQGPQGIQGPQGLPGEKGDPGEQGPAGGTWTSAAAIPITDSGNMYPTKNVEAALQKNASDLAQIENQKASKIEVAAVASGSPKNTFTTLFALQSDFIANTTEGKKNIYLVTADGNWYYWNGSAWDSGGVYQATGNADGSVKMKHIENSTIGKNLFDKSAVTAGFYINNSTGVLSTLAGYNASDYIPVMPNSAYARNYNNFGAWYDASKAFIIGINNTDSTFTSPANATYVRLTVEDNNLDTFQFELGTVSTSYEKYWYSIRKLKVLPDNIAPNTITNDLLVDKSLLISSTNFLYSDILMQRNQIAYTDGKTNGFDFSWNTEKVNEKIVVTLPTGATSVVLNYRIQNADDLLDLSSSGIVVNYDVHSNATNNVIPLCEIHYNNVAVVQKYIYSLATGETKNSKATYVSAETCTSLLIKILFSYNASDQGKTVELSNFIIYSSATDLGINTIDSIKAVMLPVLKREESKNRWYGKKVIALGDSITYLTNSYFNILASISYFKTMINNGIPATTVAHLSTDDNCFVERVSTLDKDADLILVFGGMNDYINGVPIGTLGNSNTGTFIGALQNIVEYLISNNLKSKIGLIAVYPTNYLGTIDTVNVGGFKIVDYAVATKQVADYYNLKCLDLYNDGGVNSLNISTLLPDKVHPHFDFGYQLARQVNEFINSI